MKILFVVPWYETEEQPQAGTFFKDLAEALVDTGQDVRILYPMVAASFREFITGNYSFPRQKDGKVPVYYSFIPNLLPRPERVRPWLLSAKSLMDFTRLVKEWGPPDLIHAHSIYRSAYIARQISRWYDIPYLISEHYSVIGRGIQKNIWTSIDFRDILDGARRITAVSSALREDLTEKYSIDTTRISILPNVVHDLFFENFRTSSLSDPFRLHCTAFLRPIKRPGIILRAMHILEQRDIPTELTIAGDGDIRSDLEDLANELGIGERVHFYGNRARTEIKALIDDSHAVISTSAYETFGLNLAEGLACGRPVISTDSGGPRDFIHEKNGVLLKNSSPEAVADAIERMRQEYESYDQENIRRETMEQFGRHSVIPQLNRVYEQVIHE